MTDRCLYCYKPLLNGEKDFHSDCSRKMFGTEIPPVFEYSEADLKKLAKDIIRTHTTVTGVQPKLSLHLTDESDKNIVKKFTIVGLWGGYILKPPTQNYPHLPEVEDLTMHLAAMANINVVPHSLIRLASGNLAYITRRIDRVKKQKIHMEDMCQLTESLTEHKYRGSYERIAKYIQKYSVTPGLDMVNYCEVLLFSYLTGNADMHLKNFSLIQNPKLGMVFSPCYDLVATALVNPADNEELALTLNGRKNKITRSDFVETFTGMGLDNRQQLNIFTKMENARPKWIEMVDLSFLNDAYKERYRGLIEERFRRLEF